VPTRRAVSRTCWTKARAGRGSGARMASLVARGR
jgi:hypothetical protein